MQLYDIVPLRVLLILGVAFLGLFAFRWFMSFLLYVFKNVLVPRGALKNSSAQKSFGRARSVGACQRFTKGGIGCKRF